MSFSNTLRSITVAFLSSKALLLPPLLLCLYLLTDENDPYSTFPYGGDVNSNNSTTANSYNTQYSRNFAVVSAIKAHPPSLRVFRGIFEVILLLYCAAFSLRVWEKTSKLDSELVGYLLFQSPNPSSNNNKADMDDDIDDYSENGNFEYQLVPNHEKDRLFPTKGGIEMTVSRDSHEEINTQEDEKDEEDLIEKDENISDHDESSSSAESSLSNEKQQQQQQQEEFSPPSAFSVFETASDLLILFLVCLILFTMSSMGSLSKANEGASAASPSLSMTFSRIAAPIFPLFLFLICCSSLVYPWSKKSSLWMIARRTIEAPFYDVTFRDGFVGDIFTSMVRPFQDLSFTTFYLFSGLQGWWSSQYTLDKAAAPVEHSWLVYNVVLPACIASPLWWRFLQNLRQTYDSRQRWPYLGNAFKYFIAAQVALFGVFVPSAKENSAWIMCFVTATLYQVWWDTFMDWKLFEQVPLDCNQGGIKIPFLNCRLAMRKNRLYESKALYWFILITNTLLRFCWTISFIPPTSLSKGGVIVDTFGSPDFKYFLSPALASAEIIRRTLWGLLRVELEAITVMSTLASSSASEELENGATESNPDIKSSITIEDEGGLQKMSIGDGTERTNFLTGVVGSNFSFRIQSDMSDLTDLQILGELCVWGTAFTSFGMIAAAHHQ